MVMVLWNALMPVIIKAQPINFIQAAGLLLLGRIITGGYKFTWLNPDRTGGQGIKESFREKWARHCVIPDPDKPSVKKKDTQ